MFTYEKESSAQKTTRTSSGSSMFSSTPLQGPFSTAAAACSPLSLSINSGSAKGLRFHGGEREDGSCGPNIANGGKGSRSEGVAEPVTTDRRILFYILQSLNFVGRQGESWAVRNILRLPKVSLTEVRRRRHRFSSASPTCISSDAQGPLGHQFSNHVTSLLDQRPSSSIAIPDAALQSTEPTALSRRSSRPGISSTVSPAVFVTCTDHGRP